MPAVESFGVEPIPAELRTTGWRDLFAINFTFYLNPVMYVLGGIAVSANGLPLLWAIAAVAAGQMLAFAVLTLVAQAGVDHGLPGQVAMRATFGFLGARLLSSPYRVVAAVYWFAAQALVGAYGVQALAGAMGAGKPPLVPVALGLAAFHGLLAVLGFDVMRFLPRVVLPLALALTGVLLAVYLSSGDPRYRVGSVLHSPGLHLTWLGAATTVTVICGASLTFVTNVADVCRYTPTRRDMRLGLVGSALAAAVVTTFVGGYAAAASGMSNPFVAVAGLTGNRAVLALLVVAIVVQTIAANVTNAYTAGLSLVNSLPALGRLRATAIVAASAFALSAFPSLVTEAQRWIVHLGNVAAPVAGVILADYIVLKRARIEVAELFDPAGRYRYLNGVNVAAPLAVAAGVAVYYAVPEQVLKVLWGIGVGGAAYLVLAPLQESLLARPRAKAVLG